MNKEEEEMSEENSEEELNGTIKEGRDGVRRDEEKEEDEEEELEENNIFAPRVRKAHTVSKLRSYSLTMGETREEKEKRKREEDSPDGALNSKKKTGNVVTEKGGKKGDMNYEIKAFGRSNILQRTPTKYGTTKVVNNEEVTERKKVDNIEDLYREVVRMHEEAMTAAKEREKRQEVRLTNVESSMEEMKKWTRDYKEKEQEKEREQKAKDEAIKKDIQDIRNVMEKERTKNETERLGLKRQLEEGLKSLGNKIREENAYEATVVGSKITEGRSEGREMEENRWKEQDQLNKTMQRRWEYEERSRKKNNAVIYGLNWKKPVEKEKIINWCKEKLKVDIKVERIWSIGREGKDIGIQLENWDMKESIIKEKSKLSGTDVFIDHDYTKREREIRKRTVEITKEERKKGEKTKIGYSKFWIENSLLVWNEESEKFEEMQDIREGEKRQRGGNKNEEGLEKKRKRGDRKQAENRIEVENNTGERLGEGDGKTENMEENDSTVVKA